MGHHGNSFLSFGAAPIGNVGGWIELARTTLGSANDTISVTGLSDKRYYMVLVNHIAVTSNVTPSWRLNTDTGNNYANRFNSNGATDSTVTNFARMQIGGQSGSSSKGFALGYFANLSAKEKLCYTHNVVTENPGAGNNVSRQESAGKHAQTSNPISSIQLFNSDAGSFDTNSEVVVLGWDPSDTHTSNFWEPLADVDLSTGESDVIDSGTITAKKYLWVQLFNAGNSAGEEQLTFNSDTGSNYVRRLSANGGADSTNVNQAFIENMFTGGTATNESLGNGFIINNSASEKLLFTQVVINNTAGAGTAPGRLESACKWANTASQITKLTFTSTAGVFAKNSFLKVWGSN